MTKCEEMFCTEGQRKEGWAKILGLESKQNEVQ